MKCRKEEHMGYVLIVKRNSHLVIDVRATTPTIRRLL
jgi:hypothetical protein